MAEEYRQTQLARAEERYRRFRSLAMGERDEATGEWTREPDWQAVNAIQRDGERIARMLGADLERGLQVSVITREALAQVLGYAPTIEGDAEEIHDADERELGPAH